MILWTSSAAVNCLEVAVNGAVDLVINELDLNEVQSFQSDDSKLQHKTVQILEIQDLKKK